MSWIGYMCVGALIATAFCFAVLWPVILRSQEADALEERAERLRNECARLHGWINRLIAEKDGLRWEKDALRKQLKGENGQGWYPLNRSQPVAYDFVLVAFKTPRGNRGVCIAEMHDDGAFYLQNRDSMDWHSVTPTHWQPLPLLPKEEEE